MTPSKGTYLTKEGPPAAPAVITNPPDPDRKAADNTLAILTKELSTIVGALETNKSEADAHYKNLVTHYNGVKGDTDELKEAVKQHAATYADLILKQQTLIATVDQLKREMDVPLLKGGDALKENDIRAAIELQKQAYLFKGGDLDAFVPDMENLVEAKYYRSAVRKLMKVGIESKQKIIRSFTEYERKAFEAASLDAAMFSPEMLGIEIDCIVECAELLDLYNSVMVGKSSFMYPRVTDYGAIGQYDCDAKCDAEFGPEGNIQFLSGKVNDFRGVFCLHRKTLAEANYDLLGFMYNAAARSHRINRNRALISGSSQNEPQGWMTTDCFTKRTTGGTTFNHIEFRTFYASVPVEYGEVTAVMHQNTFAYLAAMVDQVGRFFIGDGLLTYGPNDVRERIRISNCLPDPTENFTKGTATAPFTTGAFICAVGAWKRAFYAVNKRALWIEQWEGQSSAWCVKYQFGAEDGGFVACCPAVSILTVGA